MLKSVSEKLKHQDALHEKYDEEAIIKKNDQEKAPARCSVCLGILQEIDEKNVVDHLINKVKNCDFEFQSFKLCLKLPLSTGIRFYHV